MVDSQGSKRLVEVEVLGENTRLVKCTHSRARYDAGHKNRWCKYTHALLTELGMEETWLQGKHDGDEKAWDKQLRRKISWKECKQNQNFVHILH